MYLHVANFRIIDRIGFQHVVQGSLARPVPLLEEDMGRKGSRYVTDNVKLCG